MTSGKASLLAADLYPIRSAYSSDAKNIYILKRHIFGDRYLSYTIYQAPQTVHYLAELISRSSERSRHKFFVIDVADEILGYYHAVRRDTDFFLNYIAVARAARGQGLGNALLKHFEDTGRTSGCQQLVLDVFDSNQWARDWYQRSGYRLHSTSFTARFSLNAWPHKNSFSLHCGTDAWLQACGEEQVRGFSKIDCLCGPGRISVGLIAGRVCKLLSYEEISFKDAVLAVVHRFRTEREALIIPLLSDVPSDSPVLSVEKVLHLLKQG